MGLSRLSFKAHQSVHTCCLNCFSWWLTKVAGTQDKPPKPATKCSRVYSHAGFNRWPLKTFQLSFIYQLCTSTHHLVQQISQRPGCNTDTPLIYLIRCDKKMAENDLISSSRNQEKPEKDKRVSPMCHTAGLLLLWTMFRAPFFSPLSFFPLAKLNWNTFRRLKNTVKTLWIPCAAVWQPTNAGVLLQTQRGSFTADLQAN